MRLEMRMSCEEMGAEMIEMMMMMMMEQEAWMGGTSSGQYGV